MVLITIVTGVYKPTYNWGASHCIELGYQHLNASVGIAKLVEILYLDWHKNGQLM